MKDRLVKSLVFAQVLGLMTACGSKKDEGALLIPASPSGDIPGGVDITHKVSLLAEGSNLVVPGTNLLFPATAGRKPVKVEVRRSNLVQVKNASCADDVCTIEYVQTKKYSGEPASINYSLIDEQGLIWTSGTLTVRGQLPRAPGDFRFHPVFNEVARIVVPLIDQYQQSLQFEPTLVASSISARGGEVLQSSCSMKECFIDFKYSSQRDTPSISFQFETPEALSPAVSLRPQDEIITYKKATKAVFAATRSISLVQGEDYESSWKRPATSIQVESHSGMAKPAFSCSSTACVASNVAFIVNEPIWLKYRIESQKAVGRTEWEWTTPEIEPLLQEIVVEAKTAKTFELALDKGYTSKGKGPATRLVFDLSTYVPNLTLFSSGCDANGTCSFTASYSGPQKFVTVPYSLEMGTYTSPKQTLKITPTVFISDAEVTIWNDNRPWYELVLRPDVDYKAAQGSKASAVSVTSFGAGMSFKDVEQLNDENRKQLFTCDSEGICRALVRPTYSPTTSASVYYQVHTAEGNSAIVSRTVRFVRDELKLPLEYPRMVRFGKEQSDLIDSFSLEFNHKQEYEGAFPAESLVVSNAPVGVTIENSETVDNSQVIRCNLGRCVLEGRFVAENGFVDIGFSLKNAYGASAVRTVRIVREKYSAFALNLESYVPAPTGGEEFRIVVDRGQGKGYQGESLAAKIVVRPVSGQLLDLASHQVLEAPCVEGRCEFRMRAMSYRDAFVFKLIDADGRESIQQRVAVTYPEPFALSQTVYVPADLNQIQYSVGAPYSAALRQIAWTPKEGFAFASTYAHPNFKVKAKLEKALALDETVELKFRIVRDGQSSNLATLILKARPTLTMKQDLTVPATRQSDGRYTVKLSYAEHFLALPDPTQLPWYFNNRNPFALRVDDSNVLLSGPAQCDLVTAECEYTFAKLGEQRIEAAPATLLEYADEYGYAVKESKFKIRFD